MCGPPVETLVGGPYGIMIKDEDNEENKFSLTIIIIININYMSNGTNRVLYNNICYLL